MALGDGIRRNIATVSQAERDRLRDAIKALKRASTLVDETIRPLEESAIGSSKTRSTTVLTSMAVRRSYHGTAN
jgi:hypothetical protein